jgi:periplasmic divalent cation tolerance protein
VTTGGQHHSDEGSVVLVLTTEGDHERASALARALVDRRLAACVTMHEIRSVYRWEGSVVDGGEIQVVAKATRASVPALCRAITELHSYDLPELVVLEGRASAAYRQWVADEVV